MRSTSDTSAVSINSVHLLEHQGGLAPSGCDLVCLAILLDVAAFSSSFAPEWILARCMGTKCLLYLFGKHQWSENCFILVTRCRNRNWVLDIDRYRGVRRVYVQLRETTFQILIRVVGEQSCIPPFRQGGRWTLDDNRISRRISDPLDTRSYPYVLFQSLELCIQPSFPGAFCNALLQCLQKAVLAHLIP